MTLANMSHPQVPPSQARLGLILQQLDQLPTLPTVAMRVLQVASSDTSSVSEVAKLIESDPALSAKILQLVHRAENGISGEVRSIERAIVLLGFETVRYAVLAVSVFAVFPSQDAPEARFSRTEFWKHCIAVACCSELLAKELKNNWGRSSGVDPSEAFVAGLLHDLGKLALDAAMPKSFARVIEAVDLIRGNIADVEHEVLGIDHNIVGKRLAERWQLPATLRDTIWLHGQLPSALPPRVSNERLVNLVTLADRMVREQHLGYSGNYTFSVPQEQLLDALGLLGSQAQSVSVRLVEELESRAKMLGLGSEPAQDLYRQALQQAHRELTRVTDQLFARNRKLSIRSRYFEALSAFQGELRPDAPPTVVLHAIGQTAATVLESETVAVFSMPPGAFYAEVALVERSGNLLQTSLVEASSSEVASTPIPVIQGHLPIEGPVLTVGESMEWLIQSFSPRLKGPNRYWICLQVEGVCIGGVVWGADPGEAHRLSSQVQELTALAGGWGLALRTCQIRDESRALSEQLADANRRLQSAQNELVRSKMLTTVAEMAAGAAHEMNNPLAVISGRSQLLASTLSDPRQREHAQLIYEKSQALSDLITELMDFARPQTPRPEPVGVQVLYELAVKQAKEHTEIADRQIDLQFADLPEAQVDPQQVGSALSAIVENAIQATDPVNGRISLSASFDALSQQLVLGVTDNGVGMDQHTLRHAFDPFFSAKKAGRRKGMGLAKALRWIESSGGSIRIESQPGVGTRVIILLPAVRASVESVVPRAKQAR